MIDNNYLKRIFTPMLLGTIFFGYIYGFSVLNPTNINWLMQGDALQSYVGWQFFRHSPWSFPIIGFSPNYGLEVASSIVFTDSNPLLAVLFKLASPLLPSDFQYNGMWLYFCCLLNSLLLWHIISRYSKRYIILILATTLIMFNPAWMNRVGHINLMAHFLILAGIYLCINKDAKQVSLKWLLLIVLASLTHFYLAMMLSILWMANLISRAITKKHSFNKIVIEFISVIVINYFFMYLLGYFTVNDVTNTGEFGLYNNNLLSPFLSSGWSYFLNFGEISNTGFEGFNFWGLGLIILAAINLKNLYIYFSKLKLNTTTISFLLALPVFLFISTTTHIQFGNIDYVINLPKKITDFLSIFRASGRFFWPITYVAAILLVILTINNFKRFQCLFIFFVVALVQVIDTSNGYKYKNFYFHNRPTHESVLKNSFWHNALKNYSNVRYVPFENKGVLWADLSMIAQTNGLSTDAVYLARVSNLKSSAMNNKVLLDLFSGSYDSDTVYVVSNDYVNNTRLKAGDKFYEIDGFNVLAPGLKTCNSCREVTLNSHQATNFILSSGWSAKEDFGNWNDGKKSIILIKNSPVTTSLDIKYRVFVTSKIKSQRLIFKLDGRVLKEVIADKSGEVHLSWNNSTNEKISELVIEMPDATSPKDAGMSVDGRILAIGIESLTLN